jgi:hypothetical protein
MDFLTLQKNQHRTHLEALYEQHHKKPTTSSFTRIKKRNEIYKLLMFTTKHESMRNMAIPNG